MVAEAWLRRCGQVPSLDDAAHSACSGAAAESPGKLLIVFGAVSRPWSRSPAIAVTSWVLDVAADAPSLASCRPIDGAATRSLYAADCSQARRASPPTNARTPVSIDPHPQKTWSWRRSRSRTSDFDEHDGDRRAGDRPRGVQEPRGRRSRSREARRSPSSWFATSASPTPSRPSSARSSRRSWRREYFDRHASRREILGSYLNIASYGTIEGKHRDRGPGGLADLLRPTGLEAEPAAGGAAGGAAAGALRIQPDPQPPAAARDPAQPGPAADGRASTTSPRRPRQGRRWRWAQASTSPATTSSTASPTSSTTSRTT